MAEISFYPMNAFSGSNPPIVKENSEVILWKVTTPANVRKHYFESALKENFTTDPEPFFAHWKNLPVRLKTSTYEKVQEDGFDSFYDLLSWVYTNAPIGADDIVTEAFDVEFFFKMEPRYVIPKIWGYNSFLSKLRGTRSSRGKYYSRIKHVNLTYSYWSKLKSFLCDAFNQAHNYNICQYVTNNTQLEKVFYIPVNKNSYYLSLGSNVDVPRNNERGFFDISTNRIITDESSFFHVNAPFLAYYYLDWNDSSNILYSFIRSDVFSDTPLDFGNALGFLQVYPLSMDNYKAVYFKPLGINKVIIPMLPDVFDLKFYAVFTMKKPFIRPYLVSIDKIMDDLEESQKNLPQAKASLLLNIHSLFSILYPSVIKKRKLFDKIRPEMDLLRLRFFVYNPVTKKGSPISNNYICFDKNRRLATFRVCSD